MPVVQWRWCVRYPEILAGFIPITSLARPGNLEGPRRSGLGLDDGSWTTHRDSPFVCPWEHMEPIDVLSQTSC